MEADLLAYIAGSSFDCRCVLEGEMLGKIVGKRKLFETLLHLSM